MTLILTIAKSPKAVGSHRDGELTSTRTKLRRAWNQENAVGVVNGHNRVITPFRAVNNLGDFLSFTELGPPDKIIPDRFLFTKNFEPILL